MKLSRIPYRSDAELQQALLRNDEAAVRYVFYEHYEALLRSNASKATNHRHVELDDLIQELYLYMSANDWERLKKYDPNMPFVNWFSVVSYRFFKDFSRSLIDSTNEVPISEMNSHPRSSSGIFSSLVMDLRMALKHLRPPRDKEIIEALILRDEEPEQVAARHGVTVDNLYNIKRRALARLIKNHLNDYRR